MDAELPHFVINIKYPMQGQWKYALKRAVCDPQAAQITNSNNLY